MKYKLKVYSILEFGQRKDSLGNPHQEDSIYPDFGKATDSDRLFILCDGMGGHDAGEVASATVCKAMSDDILKKGKGSEDDFTTEDFAEALDAAFNALDKQDNGAEKKMGTTMTFLKLHAGGALIAHMGDSRVYHIRPGKDGESTQIISVTEDHSLVNDLVKVGELTREEARQSKQKNVITRAMQPYMERRPKADILTTADIRSGDYFYLCSDGMLEQPDMEDGNSIRNIFSEMGGSDENKVEILRTVTADNRDNHSAIIVHITEVIDSEAKAETDGTETPEKPTSPVVSEPAAKPASEKPRKRNTKSSGRKSNPLIRIIFWFIGILLALCLISGIIFWIEVKDEVNNDNTRIENTKPAPQKPGKNKPDNGSKPAKQDNKPEQPQSVSEPEPPKPAKPADIPTIPENNEGVVNSDAQNAQEVLHKI